MPQKTKSKRAKKKFHPMSRVVMLQATCNLEDLESVRSSLEEWYQGNENAMNSCELIDRRPTQAEDKCQRKFMDSIS